MVLLLNKGSGKQRRSSATSSSTAVEGFWSVPKDWLGDTVYIIAGGPSVKDQNLSLLSGKKVIVINSSWAVYPNADLLFFADVRWWSVNMDNVLKNFHGMIATISRAAKHKRLLKLGKVKAELGLTDDNTRVVVNYTSLQGAINLAIHFGAARIVLLGADMKRSSDGSTHHHQPHQWPQKDDCWDKQMEDLIHVVPGLIKRGIAVINTSMDSRINWWPKMRLEDCT